MIIESQARNNPDSNPITPSTNRYGLREFSVGDIVSYTSIQGRTSYGEIVSILRNYDTKDAARIKYEVRFEGASHTIFHVPTNLSSIHGPLNASPVARLDAARRIHDALDSLDTFDCAADHATYMRKVRAHVDYLRAQAVVSGGNAEAHIEFLYGKKYARPVTAQGNTTRVVFSGGTYDMDDDSDITFDVDDFLGSVARTPVAVPAAPHFSLTPVDYRRRYEGVVTYWTLDDEGAWGYIKIEGQEVEASLQGYLIEGKGPFNLAKGSKVTCTLAHGARKPLAMDVVVIGHASSEAAYRARLEAKQAKDAQQAQKDADEMAKRSAMKAAANARIAANNAALAQKVG